MTPVEQAAQVYQRENCARSFKEDLELHLLHGWVYSSPTAFILGRPVERFADQALIVNPSHSFENPDCWHCYLHAGDMREIWQAMPFYLPWASFERRNKLRFYPLDSIRDRITQLA